MENDTSSTAIHILVKGLKPEDQFQIMHKEVIRLLRSDGLPFDSEIIPPPSIDHNPQNTIGHKVRFNLSDDQKRKEAITLGFNLRGELLAYTTHRI